MALSGDQIDQFVEESMQRFHDMAPKEFVRHYFDKGWITMTRKTTSEMIAVMQAELAGKGIECRPYRDVPWEGVVVPSWNWENFDYRVTRTPREWWFVDVYESPRFRSLELAKAHRISMHAPKHDIIHVREVLE